MPATIARFAAAHIRRNPAAVTVRSRRSRAGDQQGSFFFGGHAPPRTSNVTRSASELGGLFLALALAFGLGGRDEAGRMLSDAYERGREDSRERFRRDPAVGRERAPVGTPG